MTTLVDSNVLLDIITEDDEWLDWSSSALSACAERGRLVVNPLVYAEVSIGFSAIEDLDDALSAEQFVREPLPWAAAFLAGKAFMQYRRRGGARPHPLPDFYIVTVNQWLCRRDCRSVVGRFDRYSRVEMTV